MNYSKIVVFTVFLSFFLMLNPAKADYPGMETGNITESIGLTYGDYVMYSDYGSTGVWARVIIKDLEGETLYSSIMEKGEVNTFLDLDIILAVTDVVALQDGTIVYTGIIVGPSSYSEIVSTMTEFMELTKKMIGIEPSSTYCSGSTIMICVRNTGTTTINTGLLTISGVDSAGYAISSKSCGNDNLEPGYCMICDNTLTGTVGVNKIVVSGPANTVSGAVYCTSTTTIPPNASTTTSTTASTTTTTTTTIPPNASTTTTTTTIIPPNVSTTTTTSTPITILKCPSGCLVNGSCLLFGTKIIVGGEPYYCDIDNEIAPQKEDNEICQNDYECKSNNCKDGKCKSSCDGCIYADKCVPVGFREGENYCSLEGEMVAKKSKGEQCENSFECLSNYCVDGQCIEEGFLQRILNWFYSVFAGLFRSNS